MEGSKIKLVEWEEDHVRYSSDSTTGKERGGDDWHHLPHVKLEKGHVDHSTRYHWVQRVQLLLYQKPLLPYCRFIKNLLQSTQMCKPKIVKDVRVRDPFTNPSIVWLIPNPNFATTAWSQEWLKQCRGILDRLDFLGGDKSLQRVY